MRYRFFATSVSTNISLFETIHFQIFCNEAVVKGFREDRVNPSTKKNLWQNLWKIFFQIRLNEIQRICKKWYLLVRCKSWCRTTRNKITVIIYNFCIFLEEVPWKLEIGLQCEQEWIFQLILVGVLSSLMMSRNFFVLMSTQSLFLVYSI